LFPSAATNKNKRKILKRHEFGKIAVAQWMSRNTPKENEDANAHSFSKTAVRGTNWTTPHLNGDAELLDSDYSVYSNNKTNEMH
jgi:hypothetical protein